MPKRVTFAPGTAPPAPSQPARLQPGLGRDARPEFEGEEGWRGAGLRERLGVNVGVMITDSMNRPWRLGTIGGSIGVSIFGAIFSSGLASHLSAILPEGADMGTGSFSSQAVASLPEPVQALVLEAFASALHPVFFTAAGVAILAFGLSFFLEELPLATTLRKEPEAEIDAEEQASAALVGAPASVRG